MHEDWFRAGGGNVTVGVKMDTNQTMQDIRSLAQSKGLAIHLLGEPRILVDGRDISRAFSYDKLRLLLAFWLTEGRSSYLRADLATLFWPDAELGQARSSLRKALSHLRRVFATVEPAVFAVERDRVRMLSDSVPRVDTDVLIRASTALDSDRSNYSVEHLQAIFALYRGDFLSGIKLRGEDELEAWLHHRRLEYRRHALHLCHALVSRLREAGNPDGAVLAARRGTEIDGDDEATHIALLRALKDAGQTAVARMECDRFIAHLTDVLEVEPSETLQTIRQQLAQSAPSTSERMASQERWWSAVVLRVEHRGLGGASELRCARRDLADLATLVAAQGRGYRLTSGADGLETLTFGYPCADANALMQALDAAHRFKAESDDLAVVIEQGEIADNVEPTHSPIGDVFGTTLALLARCSAAEILVGERAASAMRPFYRLSRPRTLQTRTRPRRKLTYWVSQGRQGSGELICRALPCAAHHESLAFMEPSPTKGLVVQGETGAGKTHTLNDLIDSVRQAGGQVQVLKCLPGDRLCPLAAFARWLRSNIGPKARAAELPVRRALVAYLGERRETLESIEPLAVTLLTELILRNERMLLGREHFDAEALASRLAPVFHELFAGSDRVLFVDNVDEADEHLLGWLNEWNQVEAHAGRFVMTCRHLPDTLRLPPGTPVKTLRKLSSRDGRRLLRHVCGEAGLDKATVPRLLELAAGNPGQLIALAEWFTHRGSQFAVPDGPEPPPALLVRIGGRMRPMDPPTTLSADPLGCVIRGYLFGEPDTAHRPVMPASRTPDGLNDLKKIKKPAPPLLASR